MAFHITWLRVVCIVRGITVGILYPCSRAWEAQALTESAGRQAW